MSRDRTCEERIKELGILWNLRFERKVGWICGRYTQTVSWEYTVEAGKLIERIEQEKNL